MGLWFAIYNGMLRIIFLILIFSFSSQAAEQCHALFKPITLRSPHEGLFGQVPAKILNSIGSQSESPIRPRLKAQPLYNHLYSKAQITPLSDKKIVSTDIYLLESRNIATRESLLASPAIERHRALIIQRLESENIFTDIVDTEIRIGAPQECLALLKVKNVNNENLSLILKEAHLSALNQGREIHQKYLNEILDFVLPIYQERRGWSKNFVDDIRKKAQETLSTTRYIVIREKTSDGKAGEIIAVMGLTRAAYGAVDFFNLASHQWERRFGPFGTSYKLSSLNYEYGSEFGTTKLWGAAIQQVPTAKIFGVENLPLPVVVDSTSEGYLLKDAWRQAEGSYRSRTGITKQDPKIIPDLNQRITYSSGQVIEPVRLAVNKKHKLRMTAYLELFKEMFSSVFDNESSLNYSANGQILMTYNDPTGIPMYQRMGLTVVKTLEPVLMDGQEWVPLIMTPTQLKEKVLAGKAISEKMAEDFINSLNWSFSPKKGFFKGPPQ